MEYKTNTMRNFGKIMLLALPACLSSCLVMTEHRTTGNPIGSKEGYHKGRLGDTEIGISVAAKKGGISKVGSVDVYHYGFRYYGMPFVLKTAVRVTGE